MADVEPSALLGKWNKYGSGISEVQGCLVGGTVFKLGLANLTECGHLANKAECRRIAVEPFFEDYRSYSEIFAALTTWAQEYPKLTRIFHLGSTYNDHKLLAFTISLPLTKPKGTKQAIWINAGLHGQEWVAPAAALLIIRRLLLESGTARVRKLLTRFDFHFTPLANPDGYEVTRTVGNRLFSKNRRLNPDGSFGVDLGRNFDWHWSEVGGYDIYESNFYYGPSSQSEPEVRALAHFGLSLPNRYFGIDLSSYGQRILYPSAWQNQPTSKDIIQVANVISTSLKKYSLTYYVMQAYDLVPMSGTLLDWMAYRANIKALNIQLCPYSYSTVGYHLPPQIMVTCADSIYTALLDGFDAMI